MKILIVEDDPISRKLLQTNLEHLGHEVVATKDGADAWEQFQINRAPVVISDWMMPEMDGIELCRKIRNGATEYTYFIMLTARAGKENQQQAMDIGVDDFLTKPLDQDDLMCRLRVAERIINYANHIRKLQSKIVTICMYTKQVKVNENEWVPVEKFFHDLLGVDFSHGISPQAYAQLQEHLAGGSGQLPGTQ